MDYQTSKMIEKQQGRIVEVQELKEILHKNGVSKYQSLALIRKIDPQYETWIAESMNWIFVYQGTTSIGGIDIGASRRARA